MAARDGAEGAGLPGMRTNGIELAGLDERGDQSPVLGAGVMTGEQGVFHVQRDWSDGPLDGVVVRFDPSIGQEQAEGLPVSGDVFQRLAQGRFRRDTSTMVGEPGLEVGDDRCGALLSRGAAGCGIKPRPKNNVARTLRTLPSPVTQARERPTPVDCRQMPPASKCSGCVTK